jgi:hypothetical protein
MRLLPAPEPKCLIFSSGLGLALVNALGARFARPKADTNTKPKPKQKIKHSECALRAHVG